MWKVKRKSDDQILVWKELDYGNMTDKEKKQLVSEVNILRDLKHQHIVRYYDRIIDKKNTKIYIIMEYWEGGDISQLIKKCKEKNQYLPEDQIWKIFTQIILALHECHGRETGKILHRDIKPGNLFLDLNNNVKLGDFGLSRIMGKESLYAYTNVGTPYYMSPEQINEQKYNEKSDIWSTGCILYEIASLRPPFEATTQMALALKIKEGKFNRLPKIYSEELWRVITLMLSPEKEKRPAVEDLLNFPQISMRLREKRLKESLSKLKRREEELKAKELKFAELEAQLLKHQEELKLKNTEIEEKDKLLKAKDEELEELRKKLHSKKEGTPPLVMTETPKILGERGCSFLDNSRLGYESSSVYHSLKQEIRELSNQVSYDSTNPCRLKKQVSYIAPKEDLISEKRDNTERRQSCLSIKSKIGYQSVDRRTRKYDGPSKPKKTYEYRKDSYLHLNENDNKENISKWGNYVNTSSEGLSSGKDNFATPPFKSYKSKIPEKSKERVHTTSYRSRSNAYNDSTMSSLHMRQRRSKDSMEGGDISSSYVAQKEVYKDHFVLKKEDTQL